MTKDACSGACRYWRTIKTLTGIYLISKDDTCQKNFVLFGLLEETRSETMSCNNESGFTLFELMVVLAILVVLSAIAAPNMIQWQNRSRKQPGFGKHIFDYLIYVNYKSNDNSDNRR